MSLKIATPVSTIFANTNRVEEILALSDALEVRELSVPVSSDLPRLYHCDLSLTERWTDEQIKAVIKIITDNKVELVSFHLAACYSNPAVENGMFQPGSNKLSREMIIDNARYDISAIRSQIGSAIVLAVENNNYYATGAYEIVTDSEFINFLLADLEIKLLLDIGHAQVTAYNHGQISIDQYIKSFDLSQVCQIHLSRPEANPVGYRDAHLALKADDWQYAKKVFSWCPRLQFVTIEYYRDDIGLITMLNKLKTIINE